ncbi:MAG TPA: sugar ABC transporter permease [Methylomirabilota bacterium]|jgi:sn-glycerol 3-phosphate transport system permease protein
MPLTTLSAEARTLAVAGVRTRQRVNRSAVGVAAALLAPTLVFLLVFTYWPLVVSVVGSFQRFGRIGTAPQWVGLRNYQDLWHDALFRQVLVNTAEYSLVAGPLAVLFGLVAAVAVDGDRRLRLAARTLIFHPVLLPTVAIAATWLFLLNPVSGPVATLITRLTGRAQGLLEDPGTALITVALVAVYKNCGLYMLFFLAGLQAIPRDLQAAARVEGASEWRVFRHVTWPLLGPITFYVAVTAALDALRNVDHIFVLTRGGPANATNVLLYETYLKAFEFFDTGRASALTVLMVALLLTLALLVMPRLERGVYYEA